MNPDLLVVVRNLAMIPVAVATVIFLNLVLCREWVKGDLRRRVFQPIRVRWDPTSSRRWTCAFSVVCKDFEGRVHHAIARTPWHRPDITWAGDI